MRTEHEMMQLILEVAQQDIRIRAVYMNGSRANPHIKKDIFQDYDIVYVVTETRSFIEDIGWTKVFGELLVSQEPDKVDALLGMEMDWDKGYTYLMQFTDGNRIDLRLESLEEAKRNYGTDGLTVLLLDKDHQMPALAASSDCQYWVKRPTAEDFSCCCNEFWWVLPYAAKGLWRGEILYAAEMLNSCIRSELLKMLSWQVGIETGFKVSVGKAYKYLERYIEKGIWEKVLQTLRIGSEEEGWQALVLCAELFSEVGEQVGKKLGYSYDKEEGVKSLGFIKHIRNLPKDAKEIY